MHSDLDRRVCKNVGEWLTEGLGLRGDGPFYNFFDSPRIVPVERLLNLDRVPGDAIFSLIPGKLAIYFFHEGEVWLCRKSEQS